MHALRLLAWCSALALPVGAQQPPTGTTHTPGMRHTPGMQHEVPVVLPTQTGQAAFATISEIVKLLEADPRTDWSTVNLEALRQHLVDMDAVTLRARVRSKPTAGGLTMEITGPAPVAASIRRMVGAHATMLEAGGQLHAKVTPTPDGVRFIVVATDANDGRTVARIRALGFIGLMAQGEHHPAHHLAIAKGELTSAHRHHSP